MRVTLLALPVIAGLLLAGCDDHHSTAPRDISAPAAPRGVYSVTGDQSVTLHWFDNTESDVSGYRVYVADCSGGPSCPYTRVGATPAGPDSFVVGGLTNGVTKYFAVSALDFSGNESDLSPANVFDTPRPAGTGAVMTNFKNGVNGAGWDFSAYTSLASNAAATDIFYGDDGAVEEIFTPDVNTDIQDAGYASSLDHVDFAPASGWSPSGSVEVIPGHCYIVWTRDNHFAKFRVTSVNSSQVVFDWGYQVAVGNPELAAHRAHVEGPAARRPIKWLR